MPGLQKWKCWGRSKGLWEIEVCGQQGTPENMLLFGQAGVKMAEGGGCKHGTELRRPHTCLSGGREAREEC